MTAPHVFVEGLDMADVLDRTRSDGADFVRRALTDTFRMRLLRSLRDAAFEPDPEEVGRVRQQTESLVIERIAEHALVAELRDAFTDLVRSAGEGIRGLATYRPNEAVVQRYPPSSEGISGHRDGRRYRRLVAVFTLRGQASFEIRTSRHGDAVHAWETRPGSLVLLRAPGLGGYRDGRPFHAVSGPRDARRDGRMTLGLRMDTAR